MEVTGNQLGLGTVKSQQGLYGSALRFDGPFVVQIADVLTDDEFSGVRECDGVLEVRAQSQDTLRGRNAAEAAWRVASSTAQHDGPIEADAEYRIVQGDYDRAVVVQPQLRNVAQA